MLTEAKELYCQSIAQGMKPNLAATAAGLEKPPQPNPELKNRIAQLKEDLATNLGINKAYILQGFKDAVEIAELGEQPDPMQMIAGYREMGKMLGYYEPIRHEITVTTGAVGHLSNEKLLEIADMSDVIDGAYHLVDE